MVLQGLFKETSLLEIPLRLEELRLIMMGLLLQMVHLCLLLELMPEINKLQVLRVAVQ